MNPERDCEAEAGYSENYIATLYEYRYLTEDLLAGILTDQYDTHGYSFPFPTLPCPIY